jgi:hypothetical protein
MPNASKILRDTFNVDPLIIACRIAARLKIDNATRDDGTLDWSKLPHLLTVNPKVIKGEKYGYQTAILHFASSSWSGYNFCPFASVGCGTECLTTSGHGQRHMIQDGSHNVHIARITRSMLYMEFRVQFMAKLEREIAAHERRAQRADAVPCIRLNGTSDKLWEKEQPHIFGMFPGITFYDYTKVPNRDVSHIPNYSLTFSRNEENDATAWAQSLNVAVVFRVAKHDALPDTWHGRKVIDADLTDLRFLDPVNVVCGLRPKGPDTFHDASGFVVDVAA